MDCPKCGAFNSVLDKRCRCGHAFVEEGLREKLVAWLEAGGVIGHPSSTSAITFTKRRAPAASGKLREHNAPEP